MREHKGATVIACWSYGLTRDTGAITLLQFLASEHRHSRELSLHLGFDMDRNERLSIHIGFQGCFDSVANFVRLRYANAVGGKLQPEHHDPNADAPECDVLRAFHTTWSGKRLPLRTKPVVGCSHVCGLFSREGLPPS